MKPYEVLMHFAKLWEHLPRVDYPTRAIRIGHQQGGDTHFRLTICSPLSEVEVKSLEAELLVPIPNQLREFYLRANGFSAFGNWLCIFGLRRIYRSFDMNKMIDQPGDLVSLNKVGFQSSCIKVSSYATGDLLLMREDGSCFAASRDGVQLAEWPTFSNWMQAEFNRFGAYLNESGISSCKFSAIPPPRRRH